MTHNETLLANNESNQRRFGGIIRLYGQTAFDQLASSSICVVGIGGVGSWSAEALARSGVGKLCLIDMDHIALSNTNRQIHALTDNLGLSKIIAMQQRIQQINPLCKLQLIDDFIDADNVAHFIQDFDVVIDAIDQIRAKAALVAHCYQSKIPIVTVGAGGGKTMPDKILTKDLIHTQHDRLLAKLRYILRKQYAFPHHLSKKWGIPAVFSEQAVSYPKNCEHAQQSLQGLNCAGYGSSITVTATLGLQAAQVAINYIIQQR